MNLLTRFFPFLAWFKTSNLSTLQADFIGGLTVALVLIPQSMAYAQLAGLPAYYGLYAAFLPPMVGALFGSSRQLATGPVAVVSLMTAAALEPLASAGGAEYIAYAVLLALLVGMFQFLLGVLKLGLIVNFLSHPVVNGFTNAAALIIATSQLSKVFGVSVDKAAHHYETIWRVIVAAYHYTHWPTFLLGALAFAIMFTLKKFSPRMPAVLIAVAVTTLISWGGQMEQNASVAVSSIEHAELRELILSFNKDVQDIERMIEARAVLGPESEKMLSKAGTQLCIRCHARHDMTLDMLRQNEPLPHSAETLPPMAFLELHSMAGLLDRHIGELKATAHEKRERLRDLQFVAGGVGAERRFHPMGEAPDGTDRETVWRLRVGNKPLDFGSLMLTSGIAVVGEIPQGLPKIAAPTIDTSVLGKLILTAIIISILGFMEAISIAKAMAAKTGQRLDPNRELIGQGLANIFGSFGQSYAVSGSFSRSAVNIQAGAVSGLSSVFTSALVVIVLLFFTPLLYFLPQSVLAAVIMMAVIGLINFKGIIHAYRVKKSDGVIAVISFLATLAFAPHLDKGIMIGVALSIGVFLYGKMKPSIAELSLWTDGHLHDAARLGLKQCKHIAVIRFDGPLFFANTSYLEDEVLDRVRAMPQLKTLLIISNAINQLDASGEETLALLIERLRSAGYDVVFSGLNERIIDTLQRTHLYQKIGEDHIFSTPHAAIEAVWDRAHENTDEESCPLRRVVSQDQVVGDAMPRVLVVDDEVDLADHLAKRLRRRGMDAVAVHDGESAIAMCKLETFSVVLLDVRLPGMNGLEVLVELKELDPDLDITLLSGHGSIDDAAKGLRLGASDYLQKPYDIEELERRIRRAVPGGKSV